MATPAQCSNIAECFSTYEVRKASRVAVLEAAIEYFALNTDEIYALIHDEKSS